MVRSGIATSTFRNATVNAATPPYANDQATAVFTSFRNGGNASISIHGTGTFETRRSGGASTSGIRLRNTRLMHPAIALKTNKTENCHGFGLRPSQNAASRKATKLARFTDAASRTRYFPRTSPGTSAVIHGSQPALEMPRERLNPNSSRSSNDICVSGLRNVDVSGTSAIAKINITRVPHPAYTNRRYPTRAT